MAVEEIPWIILGTPFRCLGVPAATRPDLDALLAGFPRRPATPGEAVDFRLEPDSGSLVLAGGGRWSLTGGAAPLSSYLEYRLIDEAIRRAAGRWVLHAGAVAAPGGTCLILGESGAGKTSLTLWLWAHGLRLGTDDLCPIRQGELTPEPFPRALHMDAEYSPRLIERIPPPPPGFPRDYYPFPAGEDRGPLPPVTRLIVLERGPGPGGELEPLAQAEAAHHLLKAAIRAPGFDFGRALADMVKLASRCRAHRLRAPTPEAAAERALALVS